MTISARNSILAALSVAAALSVPALAHASIYTAAQWTFETSQPTTSGQTTPYTPETADTNITAGASAYHAGASAYTSPAGNGSAHSYSSTVWALNDYYQFKVKANTDTVTSSYLTVSFDQTSSNTGPGQFQFEYSTDGTHFTNFGSTYTVLANANPNLPWSNASYNPAYTITEDLSGVAALHNVAIIYFRLADASTVSANGGTVAIGGTDRVDNFTVTAPEPASLGLLGLGLVGLLSRRKSR